jgi:hypothetical protein
VYALRAHVPYSDGTGGVVIDAEANLVVSGDRS